MAVDESIDPGVRLAISQWPDDAPRGAVSTFCAEHQGKNERFHQTLFGYLDKQPLISTLADLQAQVDASDHISSTKPGSTVPSSPVASNPGRRPSICHPIPASGR